MDILREKIKDKEYNNNFSYQLLESEKHFNNIYKECTYSFEKGCGSYLFDGKNYKYAIHFYSKQKLLFEKSKNKENILEIGVYMGHSLLIMLMANPYAKITCIDIDDTYSGPATNYLQKEFPNSQIEFIKSDSLKVLDKLNKKYDFFHIDGAHKNKIITKEFNHCINLRNSSGVEFIFDDIDNCLTLKKNIFSTYEVKNPYFADCFGRNLYFKILFPEKKMVFLKKKILFKIKNIFDYVIFKLSKLAKFKKI